MYNRFVAVEMIPAMWPDSSRNPLLLVTNEIPRRAGRGSSMNRVGLSAPSDSDELFTRARTGDQTAWEELFHTCYPKVIRVVRRKLSPPMRSLYDSTDFASDVMKSLAANADRLDFDSFASLVAFLSRVAEQKVIDEYRRVHALKRDIDREERLEQRNDGERPMGYAADQPTASQFALAREAQECLLDGKNGMERRAIQWKEEGYTTEEIASKTGWGVRKVQRFFQALLQSYQNRSRGK
jgi:RNA polymerase sigma factor (sigma-70 family)